MFTPKYRRKIIYNQYRESLKEIIKTLCGYKGVEILEGHLMPDHVHLLLSIPPSISMHITPSKSLDALRMVNHQRICFFVCQKTSHTLVGFTTLKY